MTGALDSLDSLAVNSVTMATCHTVTGQETTTHSRINGDESSLMTGALDSLAVNSVTVATCHTVTAKRQRPWRLITPRPLQFLLREKPSVLTIPFRDQFGKSGLTALAHAAIATGRGRQLNAELVRDCGGSLQMHVEWCEVDLERARSLKEHFLMVRSVLFASGLAPQRLLKSQK